MRGSSTCAPVSPAVGVFTRNISGNWSDVPRTVRPHVDESHHEEQNQPCRGSDQGDSQPPMSEGRDFARWGLRFRMRAY